jgi:hypothetical protein
MDGIRATRRGSKDRGGRELRFVEAGSRNNMFSSNAGERGGDNMPRIEVPVEFYNELESLPKEENLTVQRLVGKVLRSGMKAQVSPS